MLLDQTSLLTAIGFSSAALTLTLLVSWIGARSDTYLLSWAAGMGLGVLGVALFNTAGTTYDPTLQLAAFVLLLSGFASILAGAQQFHRGAIALPQVLGLWISFTSATTLAFVLGYSGIGTALTNICIAVLMALAAQQYWLSRAEAALPLLANAALYSLVAISFALCGVVLLADGQFVLTARPRNWAEDLNSIILIIGLTGVGAISVTLNQFRVAHHHRRDAMTDQLTGMLNRRALFDALSGKIVEPGIAVIMFDLDHFKAINDRLGHAIGDQVLEQFARIVEANVRAADSAARLGGEEFCIVLGQMSSRSAVIVAERIRDSFEHTIIPSSTGPVQATVSAGIAISGAEGEPFEHLLGRADSALYKAKSAGRNRVHAVRLAA